MKDIHSAARDGFSQASDAYVSGRPGYPQDVDDWLAGEMGAGAGRTIVDLGAGTGKFTRHLLGTGARVIAVEPVDEMLAQCHAACPAADHRSGNATSIPLEDESVDGLYCAQAFHWFASAEALAEIRRVLKPGSALGLIWNVRDETSPWVSDLSRIMAPYEDRTPRFHEGQWRRVFPAPGYSSLQEREFSHVHTGGFDQVVADRVLSVSFIAAQPESEQSAVRSQVHALKTAYPELAADPVSFPYRTLVAWTRKLA
ncbi:MAG: class I SAM-dependent methyltransferase [Pseudomonadota bacterium]